MVKQTGDTKAGDDDRTTEKTPYELWYGHQPDLSNLRVWGCRVLYHHKPDSKLESRVMEGTFLLYGKSDKQYMVLPKGGKDMKLVTNPKFREREPGYLTESIVDGSQQPSINANVQPGLPDPTPMAVDRPEPPAHPLAGRPTPSATETSIQGAAETPVHGPTMTGNARPQVGIEPKPTTDEGQMDKPQKPSEMRPGDTIRPEKPSGVQHGALRGLKRP